MVGGPVHGTAGAHVAPANKKRYRKRVVPTNQMCNIGVANTRKSVFIYLLTKRSIRDHISVHGTQFGHSTEQ